MRIVARKAVTRLLASAFIAAAFAGVHAAAQSTRQPLTVNLISHPERIVPAGPSDVVWRPHADEFSFIDADPGSGASAIWLYDVSAGSKRILLRHEQGGPDVRLNSYQWSPDGSRLLLQGGGDLWLLDVKTGKLRRLTHGQGMEDPAFSPQGDKIGFVQNNNLYVLDVESGRSRQLTTDGSATILNGKLDWVYGEELAYRETQRAYEWSPDGKQIAYLQLNDAPVPQYPLTRFLKYHASIFDQRFPQPGDPNPIAAMHVVNANGRGRSRVYHLSHGAEYIVPAFDWTPDSSAVCFLTMNRDQTRQVIHLWSRKSDEQPVVETDPYWINNVEPPQFVDGGNDFLWLSERDGWNHLYLYTRAGTLVRKLTQGDWLIDHPIFQNVPSYQVDQAGGWVYFESTDPDPRERQIYRERLDGTSFQRLTTERGTHALTLSPGGRYLLDRFSSIDTPPVIRLLKSDGTRVATIDQPANHLSEYALGTTQFVTLKAADGSALYGRLVKPPDFDPHKKYPVVVYVYGGPGFQIMRNQWGTTSWMDRLLADHGYLIWSMDNHGSAGRGHAFETVIFKDMGKHELADQLLGIQYLKSLPYVDASRLGIWGWSYGGYFTLYALTHASDVFKCGIAGAPVTDWHYYDTIYTERYMRTPEENPEGYKDSSDVVAAANLRAKLLLIHGVADDNVHLQNTINFVEALVKAGVPYQLYLQPGQKHGFTDPAAIDYLNHRVFEFFMHNL
ncbi:MAG: DPP IV N-terminal domain-containing protein [Terriglobia bacterium]